MCRVPVAPVEDTDYVVAYDGEGLEEPDESMLVVDLLLVWIAWLALDGWKKEEEDEERKPASEP